MGLDCSHGAFNGAYGAFNRMRQFVCASIGGSYPPHFVYGPNGILEQDERGRLKIRGDLDENMFYCNEHRRNDCPGLYTFLDHSDCEGEISPEMCVLVANELEELLPNMEKMNWKSSGHISNYGGFVPTVKRFIAGCRLAASQNEPLEFR